MKEKTTAGQVQQPSEDTDSVQTPDGRVAHRIVNQLIAEGLIDAAQAGSVWRGLAGGAARSADWRYLAEIAIAKEKQHAADAD